MKERWCKYLHLIPKVSYEAKHREFILDNTNLTSTLLHLQSFKGLHHAPYLLMLRGWLSRWSIRRMHLSWEKIELKIFFLEGRGHHRAQSQGARPLNMGISNDLFSSISSDITRMVEGQYLSTRWSSNKYNIVHAKIMKKLFNTLPLLIVLQALVVQS
jgi:hypothetical protein